MVDHQGEVLLEEHNALARGTALVLVQQPARHHALVLARIIVVVAPQVARDVAVDVVAPHAHIIVQGHVVVVGVVVREAGNVNGILYC